MKTTKILALMLIPAMLLAGCGPARLEQSVEVQPDETAFLINIEDTDQQGKFKSIEFLEDNKVSAARVILPLRERDTGRMWWSYEYIPTARVITVKRTPVTREWTDDPSTGTSNLSQKLAVESLDSIGFSAGATIMAHITEQDAARFLYHFNGEQLEQIIDSNIRGYCQKELASRFGQLKLEDCKLQKARVFDEVEKATVEKFEPMGITIDYFGASEGLSFDDPKIQEAINKQVQAEADIETAKQEKLAQDERNKTLLAKKLAESEALTVAAQEQAKADQIHNQMLIDAARAEAEAAKLKLEQKEALTLEAELYAKKAEADAKVEAAKNLKELRILPAGSGLLHDLDK
ncbi:MAG: hypothetical protein KDB82_04640 [Planctomycetes bacterium]|nr:hypothetical protein [Planctomycetota bacterium]